MLPKPKDLLMFAFLVVAGWVVIALLTGQRSITVKATNCTNNANILDAGTQMCDLDIHSCSCLGFGIIQDNGDRTCYGLKYSCINQKMRAPK